MAGEPSIEAGAPGREAATIQTLVKEAAEPADFRIFELRFGDDSTGTPAVWISFLLDPQYPTNKRGIEALTRISRAVKSRLFEHGISRVPYIRFRERQKAAG
jgi:hypothetical protein